VLERDFARNKNGEQGRAAEMAVTETPRRDLSANPSSVVIAEVSHDGEQGRCGSEKLIA
jgi:hypothetical protein